MSFMDQPPANQNRQIRIGGGGIIGAEHVSKELRDQWIETALEWVNTGTEIQRHMGACILEEWT